MLGLLCSSCYGFLLGPKSYILCKNPDEWPGPLPPCVVTDYVEVNQEKLSTARSYEQRSIYRMRAGAPRSSRLRVRIWLCPAGVSWGGRQDLLWEPTTGRACGVGAARPL